MRAPVYRIINKVGPNTTVVEQGIAFPGSAVTGNGLAFSFDPN